MIPTDPPLTANGTNLETFTPQPDPWDGFVADRPDGHVLQTSPWASLKAGYGWRAARVGLTHQNTLVAGAQVLIRQLPAGLGRLAYVPKGPVIDWSDEAHLRTVMDALVQVARAHGAIALTLEPNLDDEPQHRKRLRSFGFQPAPLGAVQPRRTLIVDISGDEDDILMDMKSKTRYNIRLAGRKGVAVREAALEDVATFNALLDTTADRADFGIHPPDYYESAFRLFSPRGWTRLLLAEVDGQAVAGLMVFALPPRSWYFYGASSTAHREKMPTYLLQWEAMRWAKSLQCDSYDLWGIPDQDHDTLEDQFTERSDGLWGVYRFKRGFGGDLVRTVGAWDRILSPLRYRLYTWALSLREGMRSTD